MIKTIVLGVGTLAGVSVLAYLTRKWWMPLVAEFRKGNIESSAAESPICVEKESIEKLSYEYIIKCAEQVMSDEKIRIPYDYNTKLMVMPNKVAQDYYNFAENQGHSFFIKEKLTVEEKKKMVVVLITTSDSIKDIVWGRVYIPGELADDFSDFIPEEKIYIRTIDRGNGVVIDGTSHNNQTLFQPFFWGGSFGLSNPVEMIQKLCESPVWEVDTVFTAKESLYEYLSKTVDEASDYTPHDVYIANSMGLLNFIQEQERKGQIDFASEVMTNFKDRLMDASQNNEFLIMCKVTDSQGDEYIVNPRFVKALQGFETNIQDALDQEKVYDQKVSIS